MDDKKEYAYVLCIGGKIKHLISKWWSTEEEMHMNMAAMHAAASVFRKTVAILVYEKEGGKDSNLWTFAADFQWCGLYFPQEILISDHNCIFYD